MKKSCIRAFSLVLFGWFVGALSLSAEPVRVTTTTTDLAAIATSIGGDRVAVRALARPHLDPHFLDATPGMVVRISRSDLLIENGVELEIGWLPEVLQQTRNRDLRRGGPGHVDASIHIDRIQIPEVITRDQGDVHPSGNPHYTLEPLVAVGAARAIVEGLIRVDPEGEDLYRERLEVFESRAAALVEDWRERFAPFSGSGVIVYHRHFDYMLKSLGLEIVDTIEPLPGLAPSARHLASLITRRSDGSARLVLMEPWQDRRVAGRLAEALSIPLVIGCPAVGVCPETEDIFSLFEANARKIGEALEAHASQTD